MLSTGSFHKKTRKGLTMIEMMGVALLLAIFSGMVGMAIFNNIKQGKVSAAQAQVRALGQAVEMRFVVKNDVPSSAPDNTPENEATKWIEELREGGFVNIAREKDMLDPWGQPYVYQAPNREGNNPTSGYVYSKGPANNGTLEVSGQGAGLTVTPGGDTDVYGLFYVIDI